MSILRLNRLGTDSLRGDLSGGVTAAIVALPLALAFGVASGLGPIAGLYGAICVGLFAALFGGTATQISGPTGPMTIVSAALFTQFGDDLPAAFTVVMLAGVFQILFGYLRLGRYVNLMPYPVISGFMTGIGCILIIMQLDPILGYAGTSTVENALTVLPDYLAHPRWDAVIIGSVSLLLCFQTPDLVKKFIPAPLVALIVGSVGAFFWFDVSVLGEIPNALPTLQTPTIAIDRLGDMITTSLVLAALGSIDSLLTSLVADNVTASFHDSDKELVGQGIGNLVAGCFGGLPGAGATIRTLTNVHSGGQTSLSGVVHALALAIIALGMGPVVSFIPHAALAGVLIKVGYDVIDWRFLQRIHRVPRTDLVLMLGVLLLTVFVDIVTAVGVGIVFASLTFVKEAAEVQSKAIKTFADVENATLFNDDEAKLFRQCQGEVLVLHLSGLMSFGAANEMARKFQGLDQSAILIIDLIDVPRIDVSAGLALEELIERAFDAHQNVLLVGLNYDVARILSGLGSLELVKETQRFSTRIEALAAASVMIAGKINDRYSNNK
jgi:SulP family sulfate permease